jgi:glycosyltransferase involved in cell wall biosynthesis
MLRTAYCAIQAPYLPGYSGGDIRDADLLSRLLQLGTVDFFAHYEVVDPSRQTPTAMARSVHSPERAGRKWLVGLHKVARRVLSTHSYYGEIEQLWPRSQVLLRIINHYLSDSSPDFLFISPQVNPLLLMTQTRLPTKTVMISWDVESIRMQRLADDVESLIVQQARNFERLSLAHVDGIITVSEADTNRYVELGFSRERLLTLELKVDTDYFSFQGRPPLGEPMVVFIGSLNYPPNRTAALRLVARIMPLVWEQVPEATCWLIGQSDSPELNALHNGQRVFVTGRVLDVRPYMARAALTVIPLESGSGIKTKLLEAFSAGVPVVGTALAVEGLAVRTGGEVLVGETDSELAEYIVTILRFPETGSRLAERARRFMEGYLASSNDNLALLTWLQKLSQ